ncbi:MAG: biotin--[acetyl-CoA-carboxylase] ligase [Candidatus Omnitrophica bacterium]|nr:biotin--[acetyl-CoA-carboxylase] ligase [Candidatus Omnitrophota bacterium]
MEEEILKVLKESQNGYVSGEEFSKRLGVTRASIWKHMESLRNIGYDIEAQPHLGYRLVGVPDKLLAHEIMWNLETKIIAKKIYSYETIDSTNDRAYKLAEEGAEEGTVVVAERQSKGKGRMGRRWSSPKGGVYLSLILRPKLMPTEISKLTLVAAVSVAQTIRSATGLQPLIKWPNDILIGRNKLCGILTELKAEQDLTAFVILGIGINVNTRISLLPKNATSISKELGRDYSKIDLTKLLLKNIESHYILFKENKFKAVIDEWRNLSAILGRRVKITDKLRTIEGQAIDIDEGGALVVRLDNGFNERILAGDVILVR